jgi:hypothetical protein
MLVSFYRWQVGLNSFEITFGPTTSWRPSTLLAARLVGPMLYMPACTPMLACEQEARARSRTEARAKLLGSLPDELKRIIGQETAKKGVLK